MVCNKCGTYVNSEVESCPNCGAQINKAKFPCPVCGDYLLSEGESCPRCGNRMKKEPEGQKVDQQIANQMGDTCKSWGVLSIIAAAIGAVILLVLATTIPELSKSLERSEFGAGLKRIIGGVFVLAIMGFFSFMTALKCRKNEFRSGPAKKDVEVGAKLGKISGIITIICAVLFLIVAFSNY